MTNSLSNIMHKTFNEQNEKRGETSLRSVWTNPIHFITCGFGVGTLPFMPGTYGTLLAIPFYLILVKFSLITYLAVTILLNVAGIWLCHKTNKDFSTGDHPATVWDEIAAFFIVMILVPPTWYYILAGFLLFRFFDIFKLGPIKWIDNNVHGGFGVMLDDIVAAIVCCLILHGIMWLAI